MVVPLTLDAGARKDPGTSLAVVIFHWKPHERGGEVVVELLKEIESQRKRAAEMRAKVGGPSEAERFESRVQSVYASLAIEDPTVTIEEVREALNRLRR